MPLSQSVYSWLLVYVKSANEKSFSKKEKDFSQKKQNKTKQKVKETRVRIPTTEDTELNLFTFSIDTSLHI